MALEIKAVPPQQLLNRLISEAYALTNEFGVNPPSDPALTRLGTQLDAFIKTFETAFEQFRYALRTVIKAAKDAESQSGSQTAGDDVEKTVRNLLRKPGGECEDAQRHVAKVRRAIDVVNPMLAKVGQNPKVAKQLETSHAYLVAYLGAARKRLDALEKTIRARQDEKSQPDGKAQQELARLQALSRSLQDALQPLNRMYQTQRLAADKARDNRDTRALATAGDAVGKPLSVWQDLFKGSRADIQAFRKKNSASKDMVAEADKLLLALNSMANAGLGLVNWKATTTRVNLATPDYGKWLKALKLDKSEYAKQLVVNFEYATRDAPVSTWAKAFDKIITSFEIPKARGSEWLNALLRAQLVPTFE
jgi:hypothetical protein